MSSSSRKAYLCRIKGIVQGVGFRPFIYRLARRHAIDGWVCNDGAGVSAHIQGTDEAIRAFLHDVEIKKPPAATIVEIETCETPWIDCAGFEIRESDSADHPTVRISPDLRLCNACRKEILSFSDRRFQYAYTNCTNCGPRYSILTALPYDRANTTMQHWSMCENCNEEYHDAANRRFHAQPNCCPVCGPRYHLYTDGQQIASSRAAVQLCAQLLGNGRIVAIKGIGGYHLACDAGNSKSIKELRERKFRKEKPFALMARDLETVRKFAHVSPAEATLITSVESPIALLQRQDSASSLPEAIAPGSHELGIMLPYTPLHVLLFESGAPELIVMTSANRSSEPIAYLDQDATDRLGEIADDYLVGERPIARRIDDSLVRITNHKPVFLRRARGYAPAVVAEIPTERPILAVGADLKNTITMVFDGKAIVSPFIGDMKYAEVRQAHEQTITDLASMYQLPLEDFLVVHDKHPSYGSTQLASNLPGKKQAIQHHKAHIASVLAERQLWDTPVVGMAFDGTGYGEDGNIWGGEVFVGNLREGFERVAHLHEAWLPGGDAAAQKPVQAAAGFLYEMKSEVDFTQPPFAFPSLYLESISLIENQIRTCQTTSVGRLFDTVAALIGFVREMSYEGQAAMWLEHLAHNSKTEAHYPFPDFNYKPLLEAVINDRLRNQPVQDIARAFIRGLGYSIVEQGSQIACSYGAESLVLSGGVFQNSVLIEDVLTFAHRANKPLDVWINRSVPANDGGISLGQAALGAIVA